MERDAERGVDWVHLPVIATVARLLCREVTLQNEYLLLENRTLKSKVPGRLRFTDEERRSLAEAALAMGRSLMKEVVGIVKPDVGVKRRWNRSAELLLLLARDWKSDGRANASAAIPHMLSWDCGGGAARLWPAVA